MTVVASLDYCNLHRCHRVWKDSYPFGYHECPKCREETERMLIKWIEEYGYRVSQFMVEIPPPIPKEAKGCGFCSKPCGNDWCPTKEK